MKMCRACKRDNGQHTQKCPTVSDRAFTGREWAKSQIDTESFTGFYGKVTVYMEAGVPVRVVKEESVKPPL